MVRESVRTLEREGRQFVIRYSLATHETEDGEQCLIQASVSETNASGADSTTGYSVETSFVQPETVKRIFEMIAGAEDPVFPIHVPEIIRDQLAAMSMVAVTSTKSYF
ncbi:MAG: hypothetical protein ACM3WU_12050 [Bacillota bacterium]